MSTVSFSRRRLLSALAAAGGAARLSPFVPSAVWGATAAPKRILTVFHPMGYFEDSFWPTGSGTNFTLGETQTALEPWKSKLLYIDGLSLYGAQYFFKNDDNEHASGGALVFTGATKKVYATGPSIDQAVADFQYAQVKTAFRSLTLGVNATSNPHSSIFFSKAQTPVTPQSSAQATFDMLFTGFKPPSPSAPSGTDAAAKDRTLKKKQSVINLLKGDLDRIKGLAGAADREKLEAHLAGISSLENRLKSTSGAQAGPAGGPTAPAGSVTEGCAQPKVDSSGLEKSVHTQMDLIAAAFACDLTRHAALQLGGVDGFADAVPGIGQHDITHATSPGCAASVLENHKKWDLWYAARWAYLLGKLDSIKEGNGTLLDNTLVVFGSDTTTSGTLLGFGAHSHARFPLWMAGGGNFAFKPGLHKLALPKTYPQSPIDAAKWLPHHRVLTSIGQAFGMNIEKFGDQDPGKGPATVLTRV